MTEILTVAGLVIAVIIGLALALPCKACRLRRERLERALEEWRKTHPQR